MSSVLIAKLVGGLLGLWGLKVIFFGDALIRLLYRVGEIWGETAYQDEPMSDGARLGVGLLLIIIGLLAFFVPPERYL